MTPLIVSIFNYGAGNLYSIQAALKKEGVRPRVVKDMASTGDSDALLLPGVGSFTQATNVLPIGEIGEAIGSGKPVMGICLGLQLFFAKSAEGPGRGLALFPGSVKRLPDSVKVPHMGWNTLKIEHPSELVDGVEDQSWVYYVHSYYPATEGSWVTATTDYGVEYPCIVARKNVFGTQFHPEKSGKAGRKILQNFLRAVKK